MTRARILCAILCAIASFLTLGYYNIVVVASLKILREQFNLDQHGCEWRRKAEAITAMDEAIRNRHRRRRAVYHSSDWEKLWLDNIETWQASKASLCTAIAQQ